MIPIARPLLGPEEVRAVTDVLNSGLLAQGPRVKAFEDGFADYCGVEHAVAVSSGTTALHLALLAHGVGPGDEVITSPFSFIATANAIRYVGARPVFVDIDPVTFNIDPHRMESAVTAATKALLPVHLYGLPADMHAIVEIARREDLCVIEDACQAHGAVYGTRRVGSFGTGCFSFYPTKNMTSGEGGMITTNDEETAERCRILRQHGMRRRYHHEEVGFNFRMTDVHAAIGAAQLEKLEEFNRRREANAAYLCENLRGVTVPRVPSGVRHVYHQYTVRVPEEHRDEAVSRLREDGIGVEIYYPIPIHRQKPYLSEESAVRLDNAERAAREVVSLPIHPGLSMRELEKIVHAVNGVFD